MPIVTPDVSPADLIARFRGNVVDARLTYPERFRLEVVDSEGGRWRLITWYADYSATDPDEFMRKTVVTADMDDRSATLTVGFSDATSLTVTPIPDDTQDAIENWELFTPEGLVLTYGPRGGWRLSRADQPA